MNMLAASFVIYSIGIALVGLLSVRSSRESESDFLLADRGLGAWVGALSASASAESGFVTLGLVGIAFSKGLYAFWIVPGTVLAFVFNWLVLAPRLQADSHEHGALTVTDVVARRFSGRVAVWIRLFAILMVLLMLTGYVAAQFNAAGVAFAGAFGWQYSTGVLVGAALVLLYTVIGGFRAIAWTDVVQAAFMIAAVILVPLLLIRLIGGPSTFVEKVAAAPELSDWFAGDTGLAALLAAMALCVGVPLGNTGQPHVLVRIMAIRDASARRRAAVISTVWVGVLFTGAILVGLAARVYYGSLDAAAGPSTAQQALPHVAADANVIPPVLGGMLIAAILAAICSTADSQLLVAASSISHDLLVRVRGATPSLRQRRILDRSAVAVLGAIATSIALGEVRSVFDFVLAAWDGLGATFGPALLLIYLNRRTTGTGILCAMVVGGITAILWRQTGLATTSGVYSLIPAFGLALLVGWAVSLLGPRDPAAGGEPE